MSARKLIRIVLEGNANDQAVHRFRNLGEDLLRVIEQQGLGNLGGNNVVDVTTSALEVHVLRTKDVGAVLKLVREQVKRHNFADQTIISMD